MFWFNFTFCCLILSPLGGCGWQPLYGQGPTSFEIIEQLSEIEIETSDNSAGESLQTQLEILFHRPGINANKKIRLIVSVKTQEQNILIRFDDRATRLNLLATASYQLVRQKKKIFSDQAHAIISYNRSPSEFANLIARRDAQKRIVDQLALAIKQRIVTFLRAQTKDDHG